MRALNNLPFGDWLLQEIEKRGLTYSELARKGGTTPARVSQVISGDRPGWDFCLAVADALDESPDKIFRLAGLLPLRPDDGDLDITHDELQAINIVREAKGKPKVSSEALVPFGPDDHAAQDFWRIWEKLPSERRMRLMRIAESALAEEEARGHIEDTGEEAEDRTIGKTK